MNSSQKTYTDIILGLGSFGSRPCFSYIPEGHVHPIETLSYAELLDRSRRFATALRGHGAQKGDRVAMYGQPSPDYLAIFLGAIFIGVTPTPINHNFKKAETSEYLAYIDPKLVIYDVTTHEVVDAITAKGDVPWRPIQIDAATGEKIDPTAVALLEWSSWEPAEPYIASPDDLVMILHTSGTTALPKGVERTHKAVRSFIDRWTGFAWRENDTMLSWHPFYHQSGTLTSVMSMLAVGGHTVQWQRFSASGFWEVVDRNKPNIAQFVPPAPTYLLLQPHASSDRDHGIEYAVIGGRTDHWSDFQDRFNINAHSPYGSTETTYVTTTGGRGDPLVPASELMGCIPHFYAGPIIPDFLELRIMGADGPAEPGQPGEIQVRGPAVFERYFRLPEVTAQSFDGDWFKTGDIGYLREDGYLFMIDRAKQVIRRSSENISPLEIEIALSQHPQVAECAVIGVPDPIRGQEILACVLMKEGCEPNIDELFEFCVERVSAFKVPRYIEVWSEFPRTGTMKIRKEQLKEGDAIVTRHDRLARSPKAERTQPA